MFQVSKRVQNDATTFSVNALSSFLSLLIYAYSQERLQTTRQPCSYHASIIHIHDESETGSTWQYQPPRQPLSTILVPLRIPHPRPPLSASRHFPLSSSSRSTYRWHPPLTVLLWLLVIPVRCAITTRAIYFGFWRTDYPAWAGRGGRDELGYIARDGRGR